MDTVLNVPANGITVNCADGETFPIPINASGEIIGAGRAFWDSPPINFLPNGLVRAITQGIPVECVPPHPNCTAVFGEPIEGKWGDSWTTAGFTSGGISCSSNAAGNQATCTVSPGTPGNAATIQLRRSVSNLRWTFNNAPRASGSLEPANMISSARINCSAAPNLSISNVSVLPVAPVHNDGISVNAAVENKGSGDASATTSRLRFDEYADGSWNVGPFDVNTAALNASGTADASWVGVWTAPAGPHRVEVCADAANVVAESDETDNCKVVVLTVNKQVLTCSPSVQTATANSPALFTASGGNNRAPIYHWMAAGGSPEKGEGETFSVTYPSAGTKTVGLIEQYVDVSGDGFVTSLDVNLVFRNIGKSEAGFGARWQNQSNRYDVNGDGSTTALDGQIVNEFVNENGAEALPIVNCSVTVTAKPGTPTYETPPKALCTPATQSVDVNAPATFRSLGGKVRWDAPGGAPSSSSGTSEFTTQYAAPGTYAVKALPPFFYDVNGDGYATAFDVQSLAARLDGRSTTPLALTGGAWQNQKDPYDVTGDGAVVPMDALVIINYLNRYGVGLLPLTTCAVNVSGFQAGPMASFDVPATVNLHDTITAVSTSKAGTCATGSCDTLTNNWQVTRLADAANVTPAINTTPNIAVLGDRVGNYQFILTVADALNRQSSATKFVRVVSPPSEPATGPQALCEPPAQIVSVGALARFTSAIGDATARWTAPDGTPSSGTGSSFAASYAAIGAKKVSVSAITPPYLDVTGDGSVTNEDALAINDNMGSTTGPGNGSPWQNQANRFDVTGDGAVVPQDMLVIINYINAHGAGKLPSLECQVDVQAAPPSPTTSTVPAEPFNPGPIRETE